MNSPPSPPTYSPPPGQVWGSPTPPRKRHTARNVLLIIGGAFTVLIVLIVIIAAATGGTKIKPAAAPSATPTPTAVSYPTVTSLLAAMSAHGAACSAVSIKSGGTVAGEVNPFADCSGTSNGDTAITIFTDHPDALAYANNMISINGPLGPTAEVVGPNWVVNTEPSFAAKVIRAVGGQLITAPATPAPATSAPAATPTPTTAAPAVVPASTAPAGPTASQAQALESALSYLGDGQGFSRAGLIAQLDSPYGGQFSVADATWAVHNSGADWNAQAVIAAKNYVSDGQGFSGASLIAQLDSPYGGQFTYAQAVYAVNQVGL
jgi:Host cell surface-exposed lipoprotein